MKRILLLLVTLLFSSFALAAVNINKASKEELDALPGIGPTKAQAIIDYRNANGPFKTPEDIMKVKGIKEGEFGKIKNDITVSGASSGAAAKSAAKADTAKMEAKQAKEAAKAESKSKSASTKADAAAGGASKSDKNASSDKAPGKGEVTDQSAKAAKSSSDAKSMSKDSKSTATTTSK